MRTGLRAYAHEGSPPGIVLERLNDLVRQDEEREMATAAYAILDPASGELTYSLAGHPPPVVLDRDGATRLLEGGRSGPVGVAARGRYAEAEDRLRPGETLLLYTDGLIERRHEALDQGLGKLRDVAARAGGEPDRLCEQLVAELGGAADDVAVLAARVAVPAGERLELRFRAVPESLSAMRRSLGAWLAAAGADDDEAYDVLVAVGEAAANAVEHAYGPVDADFELTAELRSGDVEVTVGDRGRWRPARGQNRGRGMTLMDDLMDQVDIETADHGTLVRMRRRLGAERAS
jgi:anti-sigma regulatory factor (Ser/Thr protein kinase)